MRVTSAFIGWQLFVCVCVGLIDTLARENRGKTSIRIGRGGENPFRLAGSPRVDDRFSSFFYFRSSNLHAFEVLWYRKEDCILGGDPVRSVGEVMDHPPDLYAEASSPVISLTASSPAHSFRGKCVVGSLFKGRQSSCPPMLGRRPFDHHRIPYVCLSLSLSLSVSIEG